MILSKSILRMKSPTGTLISSFKNMFLPSNKTSLSSTAVKNLIMSSGKFNVLASRLSKASRSIAGRTNDKPERALRHVIMARQSVRLRTLMPMMKRTEGHCQKQVEHKGVTKRNAIRSSALYQDGKGSNEVCEHVVRCGTL